MKATNNEGWEFEGTAEEILQVLGQKQQQTVTKQKQVFLPQRPVTVKKSNKAPNWTPEEDERLRKLYFSMTSFAVAKAMGRTWNAVMKRAQILGLRKIAPRQPSKKVGHITYVGKSAKRPNQFKVWTQQEDAQLLALAAQGMSWSTIGKQMGRSKWSVKSRLVELRRRGVVKAEV